ncbi:MAG: glycerophosphodiester phosphodiesterase [Acidobacteriota bacterium]
MVKRVAAEIRRRRMCDRVVISSFSPTALDQMRAVAPEIRTAILYNTEFHTGRDAVEITAEVGASVFNIKRQRLTRKMRRRCRQHGIPIGVYTVNKPRRF